MSDEPHVEEWVKRPVMVWLSPEEQKARSEAVPVIFSSGPADAEDASLLTKAGRLRREAVKWAKAGFPMVPRAIRKARIAICLACEYFDSKGNWGMGECRAKGCGCTNLRTFLATYDCPKKKWPSLPAKAAKTP